MPVGLSASAVFHAAALTLLVLLPVLGKATLPETRITQTDVLTIPIAPPARPAPADPVRPRAGVGRRASPPVIALPVAQLVPAVPQSDGQQILDSTDATATCLGCASGDAVPGPVGDGLVGTSGSDGTGGAPAPIRVGSGVEPPRKLVSVSPRYPELAKQAGVQGAVVLECVIDPSGAVADIRVTSGAMLLQQAAVEAVRQWRYTPTKLNGIPVSVVMTVTVRFSLRRGI